MVLLEAHKSTSQRQKRLMNVIKLLITNAQTPKTVQPGVYDKMMLSSLLATNPFVLDRVLNF
jgi:hypothetical protein